MVHINSSFVDSIDETINKSLLDSSEMASVAEISPTSPFPRFDLVVILATYRKYINNDGGKISHSVQLRFLNFHVLTIVIIQLFIYLKE